MRPFGIESRRKRSAGKVITAALVGGAVGAAVGLLMAPSSGREMLRRLKGEAMGPEAAWERARTARRNIESQARELISDVRETSTEVQRAGSRRGNATPPTIDEVSP